METNDRIVAILELPINNEVIQQLKSVDEDNLDDNGEETEADELLIWIQAYKWILEEMGIEVFETYNHFLVCEKAIYLAAYEDELTEEK